MRLGSIATWTLTTALAAGACAPGDSATTSAMSQAAVQASPHEPMPELRADILAAVQTVFDALATRDADLLRGVMDPGAAMRIAETTAEGVTTFSSSTVENLATRIATSPEPLIERMWDPEVRVSGPMATVWAPYDFYVGSTFSHCGVDTATLMESEDGWKLVSLSWTRLQPPACALHPTGPPTR